MADDRIIHKRSGTSQEVPSPDQLVLGELAINYADARLYTKLLDGTVTDLTGLPESNNTIYVSVSGNDNNNGKEPAAAFRTIKAALNAATPYTTIDIAAGVYHEDTPLILPQFTTVHGVDQRITTVRPLSANITATISGTAMTVSAVTFGALRIGMQLSGPGITTGTTITDFVSGDNGVGFAGVYTISTSHTITTATNLFADSLKDIFWVNNSCYIAGLAMRGHQKPSFAVAFPDVVETGTALGPGPGANTIILDPKYSVTGPGLENYYREMRIEITGGTGSGQSRNITSYNTATRVANVDVNWATAVNSTSVYKIDIEIPAVPNFPVTKRYSTHITASPYLYNLASVTTTGSGMEIDGYKAAGLRSFVSAQFTQFNSGGEGVVIKNMGYAQLVSIYGICCDTAFRAESGGTASMGNCNVNFGNRGLVANGVGPLLMTGKSGFVYNETKCSRDTKLIVDALAQDLLFGGQSQSTFAGIQYWNQDPLSATSTSTITIGTGNKAFTVAAGISGLEFGEYVKVVYDENNMMYGRIVSYVGSTLTINIEQVVGSGTYSSWAIYAPGSLEVPANQKAATIGAIQQAGTIAATFVATTDEKNFVTAACNKIADIVLYGTARITDQIVPNTLDASVVAAVTAAYSALQTNKGSKTTAGSIIKLTLDWIQTNYPTLYADAAIMDRCATDLGYIIDCVSFDLLYNADPTYAAPSNKQTLQAGVYYYGYTSVSAVGDEIPQTVAAYERIKALAAYVAMDTAVPSTLKYQTAVAQDLTGSGGTATQAATSNTNLSWITNIIQNGPTVVPSNLFTPIPLTRSTDADVQNAARLLKLNRNFIAAETTSYLNSVFGADNQTGFTIKVSNIVPVTDIRFSITPDTKPYLGLVMNIEGETTLDIQLGPGYTVGEIIKVSYDASNFFIGTITAWDTATETATISVSSSTGTGTYTNWNTIINGQTAPNGKPGRFTQNITLPLSGTLTVPGLDTSLVIPKYRTILAADTVGDITTLELDERISGSLTINGVNFPNGLPKNTNVRFYQKSALSASGQTFEFVGSGTSVGVALPRNGGDIIQANETVSSNGGIVYFTSTDQFGNFRIGEDLVINFNTGTLSGRTFTRSLFAQITPFVLALDS
jgi:hypothetical protein